MSDILNRLSIVAFEPRHTQALYRVYRAATERAPQCRFYPSVEHFGRALEKPWKEEIRVFVAEYEGTAVGFASLWPSAREDNGPEEAQITGMFATSDNVLDALTEATLAAAPPSVERIAAFPPEHGRCPIRACNADWNELSDAMPRVGRALLRHGFKPVHRELMLELRGVPFPPAATPLPPDIMFVPQTKPYGTEVTAMRGPEEVGICLYMTLARWTDHPDAGRIGYIGWLFVEETMRRRGLARALLTHVLGELAKQGCDGCWLTTGTDNWEAQPLYLSLGFEVVDSSAAYRRTLGG